MSGYIYRNNEWIEIGRADPSYPEASNLLLNLIFRGMYKRPSANSIQFFNMNMIIQK